MEQLGWEAWQESREKAEQIVQKQSCSNHEFNCLHCQLGHPPWVWPPREVCMSRVCTDSR